MKISIRKCILLFFRLLQPAKHKRRNEKSNNNNNSHDQVQHVRLREGRLACVWIG